MSCEFARTEVLRHALVIKTCGGPCPNRNCDKHDFDVIEGDWERDVTLPNNERAAADHAVTAWRAIQEAKVLLSLASQARARGVRELALTAQGHAAAARARAQRALAERRKAIARIREITTRLDARQIRKEAA